MFVLLEQPLVINVTKWDIMGSAAGTKAVREVSSECAREEASAFLGAVGESKDDLNLWKVSLKLNSVPVELKIDSGAEVSVIPESVFKKLEGIALIPTSKTLYGPGGHVLFVSGKFTAMLQLDKQEVREEMFVIPELKNALLGQPAIKSLNLLSRVCSVESDTAKIVADHPKLFEGLGNLEGEYRIELKPEAEPFALSTPRRVAIPLVAEVKAELEEMERSGIISRVDQPTDWCSGMVVVPKSDGRVIDLSKLNESVKRNRHILPSVEQSLAQLGGATVFSKLDANSGFWQVKLLYDIHHTLREILFQLSPIRHHFSTRIFPKENVDNPQWIGRHHQSNRQYTGAREKQSRA